MLQTNFKISLNSGIRKKEKGLLHFYIIIFFHFFLKCKMIDQKQICQDLKVGLILVVRSKCMLYIFYSVVRYLKNFKGKKKFSVEPPEVKSKKSNSTA